MGGRKCGCCFHASLENSDPSGVRGVLVARVAAPPLSGPTHLFPAPFPILPWVCPYSQRPGLHAPFPFSHILTSLRPACPLDSWMNELRKMIRSSRMTSSSCYKRMKEGEQDPTEMFRNPTGAHYWGAPAGRNSLNSHSTLFRGDSGPYPGNGVWETKDTLWGDAPPCSWSWGGQAPQGVCLFGEETQPLMGSAEPPSVGTGLTASRFSVLARHWRSKDRGWHA